MTTNEPRIFHFDKPRKAIENVTGPWKRRFDVSAIVPKMKPEDVRVCIQIEGDIRRDDRAPRSRKVRRQGGRAPNLRPGELKGGCIKFAGGP